MKKVSFLFIISNILVICSFGQESYIKTRWNLKGGYSRYETSTYIYNKNVTVGNIRLEANYGILNYIETGIYVGYSKIELIKINFADTIIIRKDCPTPFYGITCNFHILPFLVKEKDFRFDLYLTGKLGALYFKSPSDFNTHGQYSEYGLGGGLSFYLWKHLGAYAEYSYGKYYFKDDSNFRYGLTIKF